MAGGTTEHDAFVSLCERLRSTGAVHVRASGYEARWHAPPEDERPTGQVSEEHAHSLTRTERETLAELQAEQRRAEELP